MGRASRPPTKTPRHHSQKMDDDGRQSKGPPCHRCAKLCPLNLRLISVSLHFAIRSVTFLHKMLNIAIPNDHQIRRIDLCRNVMADDTTPMNQFKQDAKKYDQIKSNMIVVLHNYASKCGPTHLLYTSTWQCIPYLLVQTMQCASSILSRKPFIAATAAVYCSFPSRSTTLLVIGCRK